MFEPGTHAGDTDALYNNPDVFCSYSITAQGLLDLPLIPPPLPGGWPEPLQLGAWLLPIEKKWIQAPA